MNGPASRSHFSPAVFRTPIDCQAVFLSPLAVRGARICSNGTRVLQFLAGRDGLPVAPRRRSAQTVRAIFAAKATTATFECARARSPRSQAPTAMSLLAGAAWLIARPMQGLHVALFCPLDCDKADRRPACRFRDRLGIAVIILSSLDTGAHIFRRHQPDIMAQFHQRPAHMMVAATRFHRHDAWSQLCGKRDYPVASHDDRTVRVETDDAAAALARVVATDHNIHVRSFLL